MEDDLFGAVHSLEQTFIEEGTRDGKREGMRQGLEDGRQLGMAKGFEIGLEAGHYAGFVRALCALQAQQPDSLPGRLERHVAAMEECLAQFPLYDPLDESLQELMEALRGRHKTLSSALGLPQQQQQQQQQQAGLAAAAAAAAAGPAQALPGDGTPSSEGPTGVQQQQQASLSF